MGAFPFRPLPGLRSQMVSIDLGTEGNNINHRMLLG
jgi:hypothetical protein